MASTQIIDKKNRIVVIKLTDQVDGQELMDVYSKVHTELKLGPKYHYLWDCRYITELDVDWKAMEGLKLLADKFCPRDLQEKGYFVVVASRNVVYSFAKAILHYSRQCCTKKQVVRTLEEALQLINIKQLPAPLPC